MGNICSTRDESDLREKDKQSTFNNGDTSTSTVVSQKNVFKANPKGKIIINECTYVHLCRA